MEKHLRLLDYIESQRKKGKYLFATEEASQALGLNKNAMLNAIHRLSQKGKIGYLKKSLYQIIPEEYANDRSLPPSWFIDDFMSHLNIPYYVGLLTASSFHGSSHHAPQVFQVICSKLIPALHIGNQKIIFYTSKKLISIPTQRIKTPSGYMNVSTPEGTAFDLIRFLHQSGHLNHVATVLSELADTMIGKKMAEVAQNMTIRHSQRLGYILDFLGFEKLTIDLHKFVSTKSPLYVPLRSDTKEPTFEKNKKWHININEILEIDT